MAAEPTKAQTFILRLMPGKFESVLVSESEEKFRNKPDSRLPLTHFLSLSFKLGRVNAWLVLTEAQALFHLFFCWMISHPTEPFLFWCI